ncbi:MAG: hypothetical protein JXA20_04505 [Spirochaetes bacterium]|nr:hypothetical protein [Spirochaetota bacterium]
MKLVFLIVMLVSLQTSLLVHIHSMVGYVATKNLKYFKRFMVTAVSNTIVGITMAIIVVLNRDIVRLIRLDMILVLESGLIFVYMVFIKATIVMRILRRMKDPENYHISYFGKKVYEKRVADPKEIMTFFCTLPFTMIAGAYFVARLVNL